MRLRLMTLHYWHIANDAFGEFCTSLSVRCRHLKESLVFLFVCLKRTVAHFLFGCCSCFLHVSVNINRDILSSYYVSEVTHASGWKLCFQVLSRTVHSWYFERGTLLIDEPHDSIVKLIAWTCRVNKRYATQMKCIRHHIAPKTIEHPATSTEIIAFAFKR